MGAVRHAVEVAMVAVVVVMADAVAVAMAAIVVKVLVLHHVPLLMIVYQDMTLAQVATSVVLVVQKLVTEHVQLLALNEAQSTYYSILAAAALSALPVHAAVLMTNEGITLEFKAFVRNEEEA